MKNIWEIFPHKRSVIALTKWACSKAKNGGISKIVSLLFSLQNIFLYKQRNVCGCVRRKMYTCLKKKMWSVEWKIQSSCGTISTVLFVIFHRVEFLIFIFCAVRENFHRVFCGFVRHKLNIRKFSSSPVLLKGTQ